MTCHRHMHIQECGCGCFDQHGLPWRCIPRLAATPRIVFSVVGLTHDVTYTTETYRSRRRVCSCRIHSNTFRRSPTPNRFQSLMTDLFWYFIIEWYSSRRLYRFAVHFFLDLSLPSLYGHSTTLRYRKKQSNYIAQISN